MQRFDCEGKMLFADQSGVLALDCCWIEMNLATLTCSGYHQILSIGLS